MKKQAHAPASWDKVNRENLHWIGLTEKPTNAGHTELGKATSEFRAS